MRRLYKRWRSSVRNKNNTSSEDLALRHSMEILQNWLVIQQLHDVLRYVRLQLLLQNQVGQFFLEC